MNGFGNNMILVRDEKKAVSIPKEIKEAKVIIAQDEAVKKDKKEKKDNKKGDGINAALDLMRQVRDFQDQIQACVDAQDIEDNKSKVAEFDTYIGKMYETLLDIARGGIRRGTDSEESVEPIEESDNSATTEDISHIFTSPSDDISVSAPQPPRMPL